MALRLWIIYVVWIMLSIALTGMGVYALYEISGASFMSTSAAVVTVIGGIGNFFICLVGFSKDKK